MIINGFGAICTFIVMIVFAVTKFRDGAWIIIFLIPLLVSTFFAIHHHYKCLAKKLSLDELQHLSPAWSPPRDRLDRRCASRFAGSLGLCTLPVPGCDRGACLDGPRRIRESPCEKWNIYGEGTRLVMLEFALPPAGRAGDGLYRKDTHRPTQ